MKKTIFTILLLWIAVMVQAQTHWQPVDPPGSSGLTATLTSVIVIDGDEQYSDQLEVGVFHGDECRGANLPSYVPVVDKYLVFLSIFGLEGEEDTFRLYDHATQTELDVTCNVVYVYHNDNNMGTIFEPYEIEFSANASWFEITAEALPEEGGVVVGAGMYLGNTVCQLEALPNPGYHFEHWTKEGEVVAVTEVYSFEVTETAHYVAHFALDTYEIKAVADPADGGSVVGEGVYPLGEVVVLKAEANIGFRFLNWTEEETVVSTDPEYSFVVERSRELVARFVNTVGVEEGEEPEVFVYPNPVVDVLRVESQIPVIRCDVYSPTGALVLSLKEGSERFEVPVGTLPAGKYLVRLTTDASVFCSIICKID